MTTRIPKYRLHKPTQQAVVTLAGKDFYLGKFGTSESKTKYNQLIAEYAASNRSPNFGLPVNSLTVSQAVLAYLNFAKEYYQESAEYDDMIRCSRALELYFDLSIRDFGPAEFKTVRATLLENPAFSRVYINRKMKRLRRAFKWLVSEGMMPPGNFQAICCVEPLRKGRTEAHEVEPVKPVEDSIVEKTISFLSPVVSAMVRFQQATGCRPGELVRIKPSMVDRSTDVWKINLREHKTAYRGKDRTIYVGPKGQKILARFLLRNENAFCFSPLEADIQRRRAIHEARKTPLNEGNKPGSNVTKKPAKKPGLCYSTQSYGRAIKYACLKAFPAPKEYTDEQKAQWNREHSWAPNQIRHSVATKVRAEFGLETSAAILGHSEIGVTQVYAERDEKRALEAARRLG